MINKAKATVSGFRIYKDNKKASKVKKLVRKTTKVIRRGFGRNA